MTYPSRQRQRGAVLIVSLFFLLLLAMIAATTTQTNTTQLKMAGNEQLRVEAQQQTMSTIDAIIDDPDNMPVVGEVGYLICDINATGNDCDAKVIELPSTVTTTPTNTDLAYSVTRVGPLEASPPSMVEDEASSATFYRVARYEITAEYDGSDAQLGNSQLVQGMLVRIPADGN